MAQAMTTFATRRNVGLAIFIALSIVVLAVNALWATSMRRTNFTSGWTLFAVILLLTAFNARKKLPFLPLGTSESWLQLHIYGGLLAVVLLAVHCNFRVPNGVLESWLAWLFVLVTLSGLAGLALSRGIPRRLTTRGDEVLFERIPSLRRSLSEQAQELALQSVAISESRTLADFYVKRLQEFFERPRNLPRHFFQSQRPINALVHEMRQLERYLNPKGREVLAKLIALAQQKDTLDYHYAHQLALKLWLFVHIPLTYAMLLFSVVHAVLAYAFAGGAR
jgi:hypothetical protein